MSDKESIYDAEVAPLLLQAAEICKKHGINLVATVEYTPGQLASTRTYDVTNASPAFVMCAGADMAQGNFDALAIALKQRYGPDHGSIFLTLGDEKD